MEKFCYLSADGAVSTTPPIDLKLDQSRLTDQGVSGPVSIEDARRMMLTGEGLPPPEATFSINPSRPIEVREELTPGQLTAAHAWLQEWLKQAIVWERPPALSRDQVRHIAAAFAALNAFLTDGALEIHGDPPPDAPEVGGISGV